MTINIQVPVEKEQPIFKAKDPMSALTHFIGFVAAVFASPMLLMKGVMNGRTNGEVFSLFVFGFSMIMLYGASTAYHAFNLDSADKNRRLKKLDHMMIGVLVAGTYTPLCTMPLAPIGGRTILIELWALALLSILLKGFWVTCPKWISSVVYLFMGWLCIPKLPQIKVALGPAGFRYLLLGGILYSIGAVIYAAKIPFFERKKTLFNSHDIFHLFVMGGTLMHFLMIDSFI